MPQPSVSELRAAFEPDSKRRSFLTGLALFTAVSTLCLGAFAGVILADYLWFKLALGLMLGVLISVLFVIGHDACHDSLTPSHNLNLLLGRLCFMPTLHPYACWELGHNRLHHGWTNLKGVDYVYTPFSFEEFQALPAWRRLLEKAYRTVPGIGLFYLVEIWWKHMIAPRTSDLIKLPRGSYILDVCLVGSFFVVVVTITCATAASWREAGANLAFGIVLPFGIWNWLMAFVTIQHHTHPQSPWFISPDEWSFFHAQVHGTIHVRLPRWIELLFHNILDHTAHHVDPKVPLYNLPRCQQQLENRFPAEIIVEQSSIPALHRILRTCKLYDYQQHCWLDFDGNPSALPIPLHRRRYADTNASAGNIEGPDSPLNIVHCTPVAGATSTRG